MVALVDDADFEELSRFKWSVKINKTASTGNVIYYAQRYDVTEPGPGRRNYLMHRVIMNASKGTRVDHENHNGLDNQRSNLRFCTASQNCTNRLKRARAVETKSKYKGLKIRGGKWAVVFKYGNLDFWLGKWENEEQAARVYDFGARQVHGDFAGLNFPNEDLSSATRASIPPKTLERLFQQRDKALKKGR